MCAALSLPTRALPLHRVVWVVSLVWMAGPSLRAAPGMTPPPKRKPNPAATTSVPAPPSPRAARPDVPAIPEVAPDGPLSRSDLIQLAIQAHPDFWRFRAEVAYFLEAESAAYDWKDPELRVGYSHEFEADLERPYTETRSINSAEAGLFDTSSTTNFVEDPGLDFDLIVRDRTSSTQRTSQNRQIQTETVRRITPGKYEDIIEETTYEVERRRENQKESRRGPGRASRNESSSEYSRRRVLGRSREIRTHPNSVYGDDAFVVQGRFFIPHPWDMKARAARARAEADLSNNRLRSEVRDLVFDVGRRYDELQFRHAWHQANLKLSELQHENLKATEEEATRLGAAAAATGIGGLFDPMALPRARLEVSKAREEVFDSRRQLGLIKEDLCLLCGLGDPSRIVLTNSLRLRKLSEAELDLTTLLEVARANRPELGEMHSRADVERARLREVKALRLPWFNDLRLGLNRNIGDGYREQDEITALLTLNLPMFSWWQNKSHRQHEAAIASYEEARRVLGQRIDQQVTFAIRAVHDAATGLADFAEAEKSDRANVKKIEDDAVAAGDKGARIRLAARERLIISSRGRLQALYHYNQSVARLEQAIGLPIEEAFPSPSGAK